MKFDALSRHSLGFAWRTSLDMTKNITTQLNLAQSDASGIWVMGLTVDTISCTNPNTWGKCEKPNGSTVDKPLSNSHTDWATNVRNVGAYTVATVTQSHTKTQKFDIDGSDFGWQTNDFSYDSYANVTVLVTTRSDHTSVKTVNEYNDDATSNPTPLWLGRLAKSTVSKVGDDGTTETREACFTYDVQTGLLNLELANVGDPKQVVVSYQRDQFGNIKNKKQSVGGTPSGKCEPTPSSTETRETNRTFDPLGRFVTSETNPANLTVYTTYSSAFGTPTSILAPDTTLTRNEYDGFGRLSKRVDPSGLVTTIHYQKVDLQDLTQKFGANALATSNATYNLSSLQCPKLQVAALNPKFAIVSSSAQLPPVYKLFDSRAREIRKLSTGFAGVPIFKDTQYDVYGRVELKSQPYFSADAPSMVPRCYDIFDRVLEFEQPSGETIQRTYHGRTTGISHKFSATQTAETSITTNNRNNPIEVVDARGGKTVLEYDAGDRLRKIYGPAVGHARGVITYDYDSIGQRKATIDPDMGKWTYTYDAFGQLRKQTDAKGQVTEIKYDALSRPLRRTVKDGAGATYRVDQWDYDRGSYGQGHLSSIKSSNGYSETYFYDSFGRNNGTALSIGTEGFYTVNEYDIFSRITAIGYPNGFVAEYLYDENGYLIAVSDRQTRAKLWKADKIDEVGRVIIEHLGNGVTTTRVYAHDTGYLSNLKTSAPRTTIQDLVLTYDLAGDLKTQTDHVSSTQDSFDYDDLQQLARWNGAGGSQLFHYDPAGRMTLKADSHDFSYGDGTPAHPFHGPSSYKDRLSRQLLYSYDDNGNRKRGPDGVLSYTPENKVQQVFIDNAHWSDFEYAANGARFRKMENRALSVIETIYVGLYERSIDRFPGLGPNRFEHDRNYLVNQTGVFAVVELDRYSTRLGPNVVPKSAAGATGRTAPSVVVQRRSFYVHKNQLGSVTSLTDETGELKARFSYDPWGAQRAENLDPSNTDPISHSWTRGYTGHEHFAYKENVDTRIPPESHFVNMNGRVYDPAIGLFVSPDLVTQSLTDDRTLARYSYVLNNPLRYIDPTGNFHCCGNIGQAIGSALGGAANAIGQALGSAASATGQWLQQNWRDVVVITVAIGVTVLTAGTASPILVGMIAGATAAGTASALYGGSIGDVVKAAVTGAIFGSLGAGIGEAVAGGTWGAVFAQGGLRAIATAESGGNVLQGFAVGALSALEPDIQDIGGFSGAALVQIGAQAALNGTISAIEGDKFGNGALWGAFTQLQMDSNSYQWSQGIQSSTLAGLVNATQTLVQDATGLIMAMNSLPTALKGVVAAATFATVSTFDANVGPFDFQTNMLIAASVQQMRTDPFLAGSLMLSSATIIARSPNWQDYQSLSASYLATYGYGFAAQGPLGSNYLWQSQSTTGFWPR